MDTAPYSNETTSREAAESVATTTPYLRQMCLDKIKQHGGLTCDELEALTGLPHQTASPRVKELRDRGHITDAGFKRVTRSGRRAIVWVPTEIGKVA